MEIHNARVTGSLSISGSLNINGTSYTAATSGTSGASGATGSSGSSGSSGTSGSGGTSGVNGGTGTSGSGGTSGVNGGTGTSGSGGTSGSSGSSGSSGTSVASATVLNTVLTPYSVGANTAVTTTDTIETAIEKLQGQVNARLSSYSETSTLANVTARGATTNSSITVNGYITVTGAGTSSSIYMSDSDEGQREMHCNSNRIGFLTQAGGWGSYCNDDGSWVSVSDITAYSDARVKENVTTIDNALEKVLKLRGVYYNRIDISDKTKKIGVIAQETQAVLPEVVHEEVDGMLGVAYGNMGGLFIEAFKEQQEQIERQQKEINELKELVKQLINK